MRRHDRPGVDLYWIPLGAGNRCVRVNGLVYEALSAAGHLRRRRTLYHSALQISVAHATYTVEMTPVPDSAGLGRGVVAVGAVGTPALSRFRPFRYEIRRWRDGVVPDLELAVDSPVRVTDDPTHAGLVLDAVAAVPTPTWGRDESRLGEMWTCNSVTSWALATAGLDTSSIRRPPRWRAPGWDAGIALARAPGSAQSMPSARTNA